MKQFDATLCVRFQHRMHQVQGCIIMQFFLSQSRLQVLDPALAQWIESAQQWWEKIGGTRDDDMFQGRLFADDPHYRIEAIEHHQYSRSRVGQLVLHLALGIQWIGGYNYRSSPQCTIKSDSIL